MLQLSEDQRQLVGEAINNFFHDHYEDGVIHWDPYDARNVDILIDTILDSTKGL